jgi:hypothetical protein
MQPMLVPRAADLQRYADELPQHEVIFCGSKEETNKQATSHILSTWRITCRFGGQE